MLASLFLLLAAGSAQVQAHADQCPVDVKLVSYHKPANLPSEPDTRCDFENGKCKRIDLRGYLYTPPKSPGKAPVIIYNHGSGEEAGDACGFATYFTKLGYAVFAPHRRGHGKSTGLYFPEYIAEHCSTPGDAGSCKMEYLHKQVADVKAAIDFAKAQPGIDGSRLAIVGHSFGGIVSLFANTKELGQRAVIDFAGGSQSWDGNDPANAASREMKEAVRNAVAPVFFFEPLNDKSIEPTITLARVAAESCKQYQSALFSAVDVDGDAQITPTDYAGKAGVPHTNRDKAHGKSTEQFKVWGPAAHEFMTRYFERPAKPFDKLCQGTSIAAEG